VAAPAADEPPSAVRVSTICLKASFDASRRSCESCDPQAVIDNARAAPAATSARVRIGCIPTPFGSD
jgi:hypothetical protein